MTPLVSVPDQHEDDACCDVQTADGTGDACLHIGALHGSAHMILRVWMCEDDGPMMDRRLSGTRTIYFSIILFFNLLLQCYKEHPVLIFRFYLELHCHNGLTVRCEHVCSTVRVSGVEEK